MTTIALRPRRLTDLALAALLAAAPSLMPTSAFAQAVPSKRLLSFQGQLTNAAGQPLTGSRNVTVRFYDSALGPTVLHDESFSGVTLDRGLYSLMIGSTVPLPDALAQASDVWMETVVDGQALAPRRRMAAALMAVNSDMLDGKDSTQYAATSHTHDFKSFPPIIAWSGGCDYHQRSCGWQRYCLNGRDPGFPTPGTDQYLSVANNEVRILKAGLYRMTAWGDVHGSGHSRVVIYVNGTDRVYSHSWRNTNSWAATRATVVWPLNVNDVVYVQFHMDGGDCYNPHAWSAAGRHSRFQIQYVGEK